MVSFTPLGTNISPPKGTFEDDVPFPKVGYVNSLEGKLMILHIFLWERTSEGHLENVGLQNEQFSSQKVNQMTTKVATYAKL